MSTVAAGVPGEHPPGTRLAALLFAADHERHHVIIRPPDLQRGGNGLDGAQALRRPTLLQGAPLRELQAGKLGGLGNGEAEVLPASAGVVGQGGGQPGRAGRKRGRGGVTDLFCNILIYSSLLNTTPEWRPR